MAGKWKSRNRKKKEELEDAMMSPPEPSSQADRSPSGVPSDRCIREGLTYPMHNLRFELSITTTKTLPRQGRLANRFEDPTSELVDIKALGIQTWSGGKLVPLRTEKDLSQPGYYGWDFVLSEPPEDRTKQKLEIVAGLAILAGPETASKFSSLIAEDMRSVSPRLIKKRFTNKRGYFTIKEMVAIILRFERLVRSNKSCPRWFGGIDCHNIFYGGMAPCGSTRGTYAVFWGSKDHPTPKDYTVDEVTDAIKRLKTLDSTESESGAKAHSAKLDLKNLKAQIVSEELDLKNFVSEAETRAWSDPNVTPLVG